MQLKVTCSLFHCLFSKGQILISFSLWKGVWKGVLVHNLCIKCGTNETINCKKNRFLLTWVSISSVFDWCADSWEKSRSTPRMKNISSDVLQNVYNLLLAMADSRAMSIKFKCKYNYCDVLTLSSGRAILGHRNHPAGGFWDNPAGEPELVEGIAPLLCLHLMVMVVMVAMMVMMMAMIYI